MAMPSKPSPTTMPTEAALNAADPAVVQATAALDAAMGRLRASLMKRDDYKAAASDKEAAQVQATALHASGNDSPDQILPVAHRGLEAGQKIVQIERDAIAKDPDVVTAKARLAAAIMARNAAQGAGAPLGTPALPVAVSAK